MQIQENIILAPYTTFKIGGPARWFCVVNDQFDALQAYEFADDKKLKTFILGGGSNILISDAGFEGLVIRVVNKGIEVLKEADDEVLLKVASGEVWDEVVKFAVTNNWWGIENLSHIPGSTGAIAVQNVGAYGQEASMVLDSVTVFNKQTRATTNLKATDCGFGYRTSIFNTIEKGKYIIFDITFKLSKIPKPDLSYRDLNIKFAGTYPALGEIRQAVIEIRDKKFPFPTEAKKGNAGSFFKNLVLSHDEYKTLSETIAKNFGPDVAKDLDRKKFSAGPNLTAVKSSPSDDILKIPAAFLMDICGLKGLQSRGAAINPNQPLVIINQTGQATAADVLSLAESVKQKVFEMTGISLQFEPELIGFN